MYFHAANGLQQQPQKGSKQTTVEIPQEGLTGTLLQDISPMEFPKDLEMEKDDTFQDYTKNSSKVEQQQLPAYLQEFRNWIVQFTGLLTNLGIFVMSILAYAVYRGIRKFNIIGNYKE